MLRDKAMIIIAVSKYAGGYTPLPGAINSARRLRQWAEQPDEDRAYKVLYLGDDVFDEITVTLVREKVTEFLNENFIDRLVVYFAGHGIVRSPGDQFWLLTHAANDLGEGIDVEAFRRGLLKYEIGNDQLSGQLCIMGDACRNTGTDAIEFQGHAILTAVRPMNKRIQLDRFLSTGLGDFSFQIESTATHEAYCLFTETLIDALSGHVKTAIETEHHQFKPAITNHKLAGYLEQEVRKRSAEIDELMEPDILTDIRPPYNFYRRFQQLPIGPADGPPDLDIDIGASASMSAQQRKRTGNNTRERARKRRIRTLDELRRIIPRLHRKYLTSQYRTGTLSETNIVVCDFKPEDVFVHPSQDVSLLTADTDDYYLLAVANSQGMPILLSQADHFILVPHYPAVIPVILQNYPGDILFYKPSDDSWDAYLSDFSNLEGNMPLRAAEANTFADRIRVGKEQYPHQAVTAAYLYEFSNDYDNVARTAHYMAGVDIVPFDLALLCASAIRWEKQAGEIVAFADIPAVPAIEELPDEHVTFRPYYARRGFNARPDVRLWGISPVFRQGWNFLLTEKYLNTPTNIQRIGEYTTGRSATVLTKPGLEDFISFFDYELRRTTGYQTATF